MASSKVLTAFIYLPSKHLSGRTAAKKKRGGEEHSKALGYIQDSGTPQI